MKSWLDRLLTDVNGAPCPARALWVLFGLTAIALELLAVLRGQPFDMLLYGEGSAALLAGGGVGVGLKAWSEKRS